MTFYVGIEDAEAHTSSRARGKEATLRASRKEEKTKDKTSRTGRDNEGVSASVTNRRKGGSNEGEATTEAAHAHATCARHFMNARSGGACVRAHARVCVRAYVRTYGTYGRRRDGVHSCGADERAYLSRVVRVVKHPYASDACVRDKWRAR